MVVARERSDKEFTGEQRKIAETITMIYMYLMRTKQENII
jgi:hypothetical protein